MEYKAHVYIYNALYKFTDEGRDIFRAQCIFMVIYLAALNMVMNCYRMAKVRTASDLRITHIGDG